MRAEVRLGEGEQPWGQMVKFMLTVLPQAHLQV